MDEPDPFAELRRHAVIAWDLDDTLIGHPASPALHAFIRATPDIRHLIVTFRSHRVAETIWRDLKGPERELFFAAETIDDEVAAQYQRLHRQRATGLFAGPLCAAELVYLLWKGAVCARRGAGVLVDDLTEQVRLGCARHGIVLLHPDAFR